MSSRLPGQSRHGERKPGKLLIQRAKLCNSLVLANTVIKLNTTYTESISKHLFFDKVELHDSQKYVKTRESNGVLSRHGDPHIYQHPPPILTLHFCFSLRLIFIPFVYTITRIIFNSPIHSSRDEDGSWAMTSSSANF